MSLLSCTWTAVRHDRRKYPTPADSASLPLSTLISTSRSPPLDSLIARFFWPGFGRKMNLKVPPASNHIGSQDSACWELGSRGCSSFSTPLCPWHSQPPGTSAASGKALASGAALARPGRGRAARRQPTVAEGEPRADASSLACDWAAAPLRKHRLASGGTVAYGRTGTAGPPEESQRRGRQAVVRGCLQKTFRG